MFWLYSTHSSKNSGLIIRTFSILSNRNDTGLTLLEILVVVVILGILAAIGLPSFFNSVHTCFRDPESCINQDPIQKGCDRNIATREEATVNGIHIELRYSPQCHMTWVRSTAPSGSTIFVVDADLQTYGHYLIQSDGFNQHYSDMGPGFAKGACAELPSENTVCTDSGTLLILY